MARILVIDDHEASAQAMARLLSLVGHETRCVTDSGEAMPTVRDFEPDLIFLDVMMPRIDGLQILEEIRSSDATRDTPVVMLSALTDPKTRERAEEIGADAFWVKSRVDYAEAKSEVDCLLTKGHRGEC